VLCQGCKVQVLYIVCQLGRKRKYKEVLWPLGRKTCSMFRDAGIDCQGDVYVVVFEVKGVGIW